MDDNRIRPLRSKLDGAANLCINYGGLQLLEQSEALLATLGHLLASFTQLCLMHLQFSTSSAQWCNPEWQTSAEAMNL